MAASDERDVGDGTGPTPAVAPDPQVCPRLLELLICPLTKTRLSYSPERHALVSKAAGVAFPIRDGVPLMTSEAAERLTDDADE